MRAESNTPKGARFLVRIPLMGLAAAHASETEQGEKENHTEHARELGS